MRRASHSSHSSILTLGAAMLLLASGASGEEPAAAATSIVSAERAAPVDLRDPRPRPIEVRFEVSPPDAPGRLAASWTEPARAWLSPTEEPDRVRIRVGARTMEGMLAAQDPVPGSFSDFVWTLDSASGHVLSASFTGTLRRPVDLGPWTARVETDIRVDMDTRQPAGFLSGRHRFGHLLFEHCESMDPGCTLVAPRPYDPSTGYVNAVGAILARGLGWLRVTSFSPLGEAIFREVDAADPALSAVGAAPAPSR